MSMFIENLQLISVNSTIQPEQLKQTDEAEIGYSVHPSVKGQSFRVLQYTCFTMVKGVRQGQIDVSFEVALTPEALTEEQIDSYLISTIWAYFRQQVMGFFTGWNGLENLDLPIEFPIPLPLYAEKVVQEVTSKTVIENLETLRPWERQWDGEISENFRVSLLITRILSDINERKKEWYFSILELYAYLCIAETEKSFINTNITIETLDPKVIDGFIQLFGFSPEDWCKIEENGRSHLIKLTEETLFTAFLSVMCEEVDPITSIIPDEYMNNVEENFWESQENIPKTPEESVEIYEEMNNKILETFVNTVNEIAIHDPEHFSHGFSHTKIKAPVFHRHNLILGFEAIANALINHNEVYIGSISIVFWNEEKSVESFRLHIGSLHFV